MQIIASSLFTKRKAGNIQHHGLTSKQFADQRIFHKSHSILNRVGLSYHDNQKNTHTSTDLATRRIRSGRPLIFTRKCAQTERIQKENQYNMNNIFDTNSWEKHNSLQLIKRIKNKMEHTTKKEQMNNILNQILQKPITLIPLTKDSEQKEKKQGKGKNKKQLWCKKKLYVNNNRNTLKKTQLAQFQLKSKKTQNQFSGWTKGSLSQFQSMESSFINTDKSQFQHL